MHRTLVIGVLSTGLALSGPVFANDSSADADLRALVDNEARNVILATYAELETRAATLEDAVADFADQRTPTKLETARQAWINARRPWEQSESFLVGPVATQGIDPALDSWPVDESGIGKVLGGDGALTPARVGELSTGLRGFHTIEFLLFGQDGDKKASEFTDRGVQYLHSTTRVLHDDTRALYQAWAPTGGDYIATFVGAEKFNGNRARVVSDQLTGAMAVIAGEVAAVKIATPLKKGSIHGIESKYSGNTLTDIENNLRSIRHVYTGDYGDNTGPGIDILVRQAAPGIDQRFLAELQTAIDRIEAVDGSFRDAVKSGDTAALKAAGNAVMQVQETVKNDIQPLLPGAA